MSTAPPSVAHYQRLQGYSKVVHNLVFNRNSGEFEVMEQPTTSSPAPATNPSYSLSYTDGALTQVDMTVGGITYRRTLSYTSGALTGVSAWVEL